MLIKTSIKNCYFIWSTKHSFCLTLCKTGLNQHFFTVVVISELGWILLAWPELLVCSWSSARQWLWPTGTWASWTGWDWSCNPEWVLVSQWDVGGCGFGHRCGHLWQEELERSGKYFQDFFEKAVQAALVISLCLFICDFAYMRLRFGHFSETYPLIYSHPWSFYMQTHYMGEYFFGPFLSQITRETYISKFLSKNSN